MNNPENSLSKMLSNGFVAGTLVHTQAGLVPIEHIKVGDFVLSKPESGEGVASYKRVARTFETEGQEVWYVNYTVKDSEESEFLVVTGEHPFRAKLIWCPLAQTDDKGIFKDIRINDKWVSVAQLYNHEQNMNEVTLELMDGREVWLKWINPIITSDTAELFAMSRFPAANHELDQAKLGKIGIIYTPEGVGDGSGGSGIKFTSGYPEICCSDNGEALSVFPDHEDLVPFNLQKKGSISEITLGYKPLLNTVYNFEVEDNHTYCVGKLGIWVHDAIQQTS